MHLSTIPGHGYAYFAVTAGVFVTAFYSFRMLFLAFHGQERFDAAPHAADGGHAHDAGARPGRSRTAITTPDRPGRARGW